MFYKHNMVLTTAALCLLSTTAQSGDNNTKQENKATIEFLNRLARFGSTASFGYWIQPTLSTIRQYGIPGAIATTHLPRLAIDLACVEASYTTAENSTPLSAGLNTAALLGSLASLAYWGPATLLNCTNPFYLVRIAIDIAQIGLASKRLYDSAYKKA